MRVLHALILLWLVTTLTFALIHSAPGDPATLLISPSATAAEVQQQRAVLGLDASLPTQYVRWLSAMLRGDLGMSMTLSRPVTNVIANALPISLALGGLSLVASFVFGIFLGVVQAFRAPRLSDTAITIVTTTVFAAPSFWLALALVAAVTSGAAWLGVPLWMRLPAFGMRDAAGLATGFGAWRDLARHAVLPLLVLSLPGAAGVARYARTAVLEALSLPHVQAARARGFTTWRVALRHVLRNAWTPLVVLLGLTLPGLIAGSVFVEQVFAWPGLGRTMLTAIAARDYPVVLGLTFVYAATVIVSNVMSDVIIMRLDPRRRA